MDYGRWNPLAGLLRQDIFDADTRKKDGIIADVADFLTVEDMNLDYLIAVECDSFATDEK